MTPQAIMLISLYYVIDSFSGVNSELFQVFLLFTSYTNLFCVYLSPSAKHCVEHLKESHKRDFYCRIF